jgi:hypothetical protein
MERCQLIQTGLLRRCNCRPDRDLSGAKINIGGAENLTHVIGRSRAKPCEFCEADNTSATASQRIGNLAGIATPRRCKDGHALMIIPASQRRCRINDDGASDCLGRRKTTQNSTLTGKGGDRRCKAELGIVTFARFDAIAATKPDGRGCAARPVQNAHVFKMPQRAVSPGRYRQAYIDLGRGRKTAWRTDYITWADVVARHISQVDRSTTAGVDILPVDAMGLKTADDHRSAYRRHDCL